jgi:hypothetical protein
MNASTKTLDLRGLAEDPLYSPLNEAVNKAMALAFCGCENGVVRSVGRDNDEVIKDCIYCNPIQPYSYSCDTTAPFLIGRHWNAWTQSASLTGPIRHFFGIYPERKNQGYEPSFASTEPLSRCYALLRDAGWKVLT